MQYRSWLHVPANSEKKLAKAASTGADIAVIDLTGDLEGLAVDEGRRQSALWLSAHRQQITENRRLGRWVRINPLDSRKWRDDLIAIMSGAPDGIVLPRATGPEAVRQLAAELYELEQVNRLANGSVRIIPVVGETPTSALTIPSYLDASLPRMAGIMWSPPAIGSSTGLRRGDKSANGWSDASRYVRAQALLTAHALNLMAIDTCQPDCSEIKELKLAMRDARGEGFTGMVALHPDQVEAINQGFSPSTEELDHARALVAAFDGTGDGVEVDRRLIAQPQLTQARRLLGLDDRESSERQQRATILRPA